MRRFVQAAAVLALVVGGVGQTRANLIVNGGFETGNFSDWNVTQGTPGDLGTYILVASTQSYYFPHSGSYEAVMGAINNKFDSISQTLTTIPGNSYTVDFWLLNGQEASTTGSSTSEFQVSWGGNVILDLVNFPLFPYTEETLTVKATGTSTTLELSAYQTYGHFSLDDVSVSAVVPEPSTLTGAGIAVFLGLACAWRRRKEKHAA